VRRTVPLIVTACLALALGAATPAAADDPDFISFGVGYFDFDKNDNYDAADFRLEYRSDWKFLYLFKPWVGAHATSDGALFGGAGVLIDVFFGRRVIVTGSFGPGFYHDGDGKDLGHTIEFRSMIEAGYRFDDRSRLTAQLSHLSNASLGNDNPGVNILGLYYHVPVSKIFGD